MRHPTVVFALVLMVLPAAALVQAQSDRLTPRPPPTAVLPKATPVHTEPKGKAPAGQAALLPLPVAPVPLSPVFVPGEPPPGAAPPPVAPVPAAPAAPAPTSTEAKGPLPPVKPKLAEAEAPKPAPAPEKPTPEKPAAEKPAPEKPVAENKPVGMLAGKRTVYAKDDVYIRATPGRGGKVLDALEPGAAVDLLPGEAEDGWVRVARNGKPLGWVAADFLLDRAPGRKSADGCALPPDLPNKRVASIAEGSVARALAGANVRQTPTCNGRVLDVLEEGERVTVTAVSGTWYRVARKGRTLGYVSAALLGEAKGR